MAVAVEEPEHDNEREGGRSGRGEEREGGIDTAHIYCCLLLSQRCGGWWNTHRAAT